MEEQMFLTISSASSPLFLTKIYSHPHFISPSKETTFLFLGGRSEIS
jgi:hypothetical protein